MHGQNSSQGGGGGRGSSMVDRSEAKGGELHEWTESGVEGGELYVRTEQPPGERKLYAWTEQQRREGRSILQHMLGQNSGGERGALFPVDRTEMRIQRISTYAWSEQMQMEERSVLHSVCTEMAVNGSVCQILRYPVPSTCTRLKVSGKTGLFSPGLLPVSRLPALSCPVVTSSRLAVSGSACLILSHPVLPTPCNMLAVRGLPV